MLTNRRDFLRQSIYFGAAASLPVHGLLAQPDTGLFVKPPFPELKASGSPGHMGRSHGKTFSTQVKHNIGFYLGYLTKKTGSDEKEILVQAQRFAKVLTEHCPDLLEEMQGIAKGARCSLDEILVVNARTDLIVLGTKEGKGKQKKQKREESQLPGCTALALIEKHRGRNMVALGQNWDWNRALRKNCVVLRLRPKKGRRIVTFTEAGMVGKIGFNDKGLGVCLNFLSHRTDDPLGEPGIPVHVLLRAVMTCDTLDAAAKLIAASPRCASANFLMAQGNKKIASLSGSAH